MGMWLLIGNGGQLLRKKGEHKNYRAEAANSALEETSSHRCGFHPSTVEMFAKVPRKRARRVTGPWSHWVPCLLLATESLAGSCA